ncbi:MAG: sulfatase-like hydrolase/transferase, partial [Proteobacteria bacterium]|nr:sulfatase-like hydrolase/transferase [Pseudomonadota bacterium]
VLLITLDTVRADHIGSYGYDKGKTPVIDELASEGMLFERALAVAPITMPTHSSIMTGQYPYRHGARNNGSFPLDQAATILAERFLPYSVETTRVFIKGKEQPPSSLLRGNPSPRRADERCGNPPLWGSESRQP